MSIALGTTQKLEIVLGGAAAANQLPFVVTYADYVGATPAFTPATFTGLTNDAVDVDLLAAPGSGQRVVRTINIYNADTGSVDVTVKFDDNATERILQIITLATGFSLCYDEDGWKVLSDKGQVAGFLGMHDHSSDAEGGATLGAHFVNGILTLINAGLHLLDTDASHDLVIKPGSDLTADRILSLVTGDAARTITLSGNPTMADWFDQAVKVASSPQFAKLGLGAAVGTHLLNIEGDQAGYLAKIFNDGNADDHRGLEIQCGADANPSVVLIRFYDGDGTTLGYLYGDGAGGVSLYSSSDERTKNILGDVDQDLSIAALKDISPIQYVGKGLTSKTGKKRIGFRAQSIFKHFPELVRYDEEEDLYTVDYGRISTILWAQNQALLARIEKLEEPMLEERIAALEAMSLAPG